jgi:hypothetical protein
MASKSPKKGLDSSHLHSLHLSPHTGILPPQVTKQLHKNAQLNLQKILCSISHPPIYIQAFHIAAISINSSENDSTTQF